MTPALPTPRAGYLPCNQVAEAVAEDEAAVRRATVPFPHRFIALTNLAISTYSRYRCAGRPDDLRAAIGHQQAAIACAPAGHPERDTAESNLAMLLMQLDRPATNQMSREMIEARIDRVEPGSVEQLLLCAQLGEACFHAFGDTGQPAELTRAIDLFRESLAGLPGDEAERPIVVTNLATALLTRCALVDNEEADLREAVEIYEGLLPKPGAPAPAHWTAVRGHLSAAYVLLHQWTGDDSLLDLARELQAAVDDDDPLLAHRLRAPLLDIAANQAMARYVRTASLRDLDRAIEAQSHALDGLAEDDPSRGPLLMNLAICYQARFESLRDVSMPDALTALGSAIEVAEDALPRTVHPYRANLTGLLGWLYFCRHTADPARPQPGVDEAVRLLEAALDSGALPPRDRNVARDRLAQCLVARGGVSGRLADVQAGVEAIDALRAEPSLPPEHRIELELALADALAVRARMTRQRGHAEQAMETYRSAFGMAGALSDLAAFTVAAEWGRFAWLTSDLVEAGEAYRHAIDKAYRLTARQVLREDKYESVRRIGDLAARAAYALAGHDPAGAALALETGRALLLSEVLERDRAELDQLAASGHPDVVDRYRAACGEVSRLERALATSVPAPAGRTVPHRISADAAPADVQGLEVARERLATSIAEIRALPGHEHFLEPPGPAQLRRITAERSDPVVYLAATAHGGLALVLRPTDPEPVPVWLPRLTTEEQAHLVERVGRAVADRNELGFARAVERLWDVVMGPVVEELGNARAAVLIPTGRLGQLPLHAAGHRDRSGSWRHALDKIVFSYAPNARALGHARTSAAAAGRGGTVLAVADPEPPPAGLPALTMARTEAREAARHFPRHQPPLAGEAATPAAVREYLGRADVYHFACHSGIDTGAILDSGLELAGGRLTLRDLLAARLTGARLAVLSACATAASDAAAPDEVIGLPGAMLQAGLPGVVASMWRVDDVSTMLLMTRFYRLWRAQGLPPAEALRDAQRWLRGAANGELHRAFPDVPRLAPPADADRRWAADRDHAGPLAWAPFVYVGG